MPYLPASEYPIWSRGRWHPEKRLDDALAYEKQLDAQQVSQQGELFKQQQALVNEQSDYDEQKAIRNIAGSRYLGEPDALYKATVDVRSAKSAPIYEGVLAAQRNQGMIPRANELGQSEAESTILGNVARSEVARNVAEEETQRRPFIPGVIAAQQQDVGMGARANVEEHINRKNAAREKAPFVGELTGTQTQSQIAAAKSSVKESEAISNEAVNRSKKANAIQPLLGELARAKMKTELTSNNPQYVNTGLEAEYQRNLEQSEMAKQHIGWMRSLENNPLAKPILQHLYGGRAPNLYDSMGGGIGYDLSGGGPFPQSNKPITGEEDFQPDASYFRGRK